MRFAVFVFSILLIFSTTYAHALAFVPAVVGGLVRTAGGAVIKVANKKTLATFAIGAVGASTPKAIEFAKNYCVKHSKKCKDWVGDVAETFFDDDNTNQSTYSCSQGKCYQCKDDDGQPISPANYLPKYCASIGATVHQWIPAGNQVIFTCDKGTKFSHRACKSITQDSYDEQQQAKKQQTAQKIIERIKDDDPDYIINNYGDQINIDKYCAAPGACAELEQSFGDEVMNNKNKYDIDKINKDNCEVKNGKITSCDKAKKDTDDDDSDTPKEPKKPDDGDDGQDGQDDDSDDTKPKDKPINCDSSLFHKKVCDFIDWYQSDDYEKTDNKINIQDDTPKPTNTNIEFSGSCPASYVVSHTLHFGMLGSYDFEFTLLDTPKLCTFLNDWIKPIMMFLGPLHAVYIIGKRDE